MSLDASNLQILCLILLFIHALNFTRLSSISFIAASALAFGVGIFFQNGLAPSHWALAEMSWSNLRQFFFLLVSGLGIIIGIYSHIYMGNYQREERSRFFGYLGLFQWTCLLLVISNHIYLFATAWELTSITSFLLIGFDRQSPKAQRGAIQAFLVTGLGGICLLGSLVLLSQQFQTYFVDELILRIATQPMQASVLATALLMLAALTKSAQFPFHFWLPDAMHAPTPVSAYLHSATLVKLGIFLVALFWPGFQHNILWHVGLSGLGLITFAWGAGFSILQTDMKASLAHTTYSQLGLMMMLFSLTSDKARAAGFVVLLAHALYKSSLFLSVGVISKATKSLDLRKCSGILRHSKVFLLLFAMAILSLIASPGSLGFVGKEWVMSILSGPFASSSAKYFSWACFVTGAYSTVLFGVLFFLRLYQKHTPSTTNETPKLSTSLALSFGILPLLGILFGCFLEPIFQWLDRLSPTAEKIESPFAHLLSGNFVLSILILLAGSWSAYKLSTDKKYLSAGWESKLNRFSLSNIFQNFSLERLPTHLEAIIYWFEAKTSKMAPQIVFLFFILLMMPLVASLQLPPVLGLPISSLGFVASVSAASLLALIIYFISHSMTQIFLLGAVGYLVAFSYASFGAPDLVLTQIIIETASLVLLVFAWLLSNERKKHRTEKLSKLSSIYSWLFSVGASIFLIGFLFLPPLEGVSQKLSSLYFFENSEALAFGTNIVNVIIVDFRGLDTLGEISVLALAALGAQALFRRRFRVHHIASHPFSSDWTRRLAKIFSLALLLFGVFYLSRGHHAPGGGFIGGGLGSLTLAMWMMSYGRPIYGSIWAIVGLVIAYASALLPQIFGLQFFESFSSPIGPSSLFFDIGVFAVVTGSVASLLEILYAIWTDQKGRRSQNA
ncbi:MAG: hypothetical protein COV44_02180 [Deltaproteobacteria bacterium CG11_big_fil_rev_8_21_14_0_20_45_16]|nr:MAG: hypothetical protein COV44_02180 [Deltaproteobacteria bacterium CG11_big_fil_rev_8_21_14_0_20_45_16]